MNKTALVIMAAGMGSRYGQGIKQLERVGVSGEIIMEYSIYDAIAAGFDKIVFITRRDIFDEFKKIINPEIEKKIEVEYVFQEKENLPAGYTCPADRSKPWGTGHAILSCLGAVKEPFAVINADDYYGKEAFVKLHDYLANMDVNADPMACAMVGFVLENTLSDNGKVTRGRCEVDGNGFLSLCSETYDIYKDGDVCKGKDGDGNDMTLPLNTPVSMNMWGLPPKFLDTLEDGFKKFLDENMSVNPLKCEYLLPNIVGDLLKANKATVKVLTSNDKWFGVTYHEDKEFVVKSFKELYEKGAYPKSLF